MSTPSHGPTRAAVRMAAALALAWTPGALVWLAPEPLAAQGAAQATGRITGVVTGEGAQPLTGVQVTVVGTRLGATTGTDGRYFISGVAAGTVTVRAARIGYAPSTQTVTVASGGAVTADFALTVTATQLSAQVVVGYTTQQRRDVSDATAGVRGEEIQDQKVATVEEAVRGRIPGVQVTASGEPGRPPQILVRGNATLGTNPSPLYVVDGVYMTQNPNLNPNEIESIDVLKDASAAAQYGAQAANGVIVVRTKRGRPGDTRVDLRAYYGYQEVPNKIDVMNSAQWAAVTQQAYINAGRQSEIPQSVTEALAGGGVSTDWQDAMFQQGAIQDYNLSVSGGSSGASYLISGGYLDQKGSVIETGFNRYSFRLNSDLRRGRFTFGENIAVSQTNRQELLNAAESDLPGQGVLVQAVRLLPVIPVRDPNSPSGWGYGSDAAPTFGYNPVALQSVRPRDYRSNQVIGSAFAEVALPWDLRYRLNGGVNYNGDRFTAFTSQQQVRFRSPIQFATFGELRGQYNSTILENLLTWDRAFAEKHRLTAVAGYTQQRTTLDTLYAYRQGYADEDLQTIDAGEQNGQRNAGGERVTKLNAWLGRANYSFADRYLVTGSIRRDCSSRFSPDNRCGTFGAGSVGWVMSEEGFFRSIPLLGGANFFKLRASTGVLGLQDVSDYGTSAVLNQNANYLFGGQPNVGTTQLVIANPNLKWQENQMTNVGLDLTVAGDRLTFTADYYTAEASDLLVRVPLPSSVGATEDPFVNAGSLRNTGFELGATHRWAPGKFQLNTTATLTTTKNKVLSLGGGQPINVGPSEVARTLVGQPVGSFYVIRSAGIFQSDAEVQAHTSTVDGVPTVIQPDAEPGDVRYADVAGGGPNGDQPDGQITDADRVNAGNGTPKYQAGLFFDSRYGNWDFGLNLRGAGGFKIYNYVRYWGERTDDPSNLRAGLTPWTPENGSATTPRALAAGNRNNLEATDRWIEDGDFIRIQNLVLGYRIPGGMMRRMGVPGGGEGTRVYLNIQNLYTFTDYSGWDPEVFGSDPSGSSNALGRGIDAGRIYPQVRTFTLGVDLRL